MARTKRSSSLRTICECHRRNAATAFINLKPQFMTNLGALVRWQRCGNNPTSEKVTVAATWCYNYDSERKQPSSQGRACTCDEW
ncbi:hypothetical protein V5799_015984 [Amblyomma americanum]|uniref:Uncharacterized protein n=1 Tax=Amblyomma americanum TaxID=6943 RepID=A0AAQ4F6A4_AMBAM